MDSIEKKIDNYMKRLYFEKDGTIHSTEQYIKSLIEYGVDLEREQTAELLGKVKLVLESTIPVVDEIHTGHVMKLLIREINEKLD